ncbi:MAG: AMIN domain-containing protein [Proteobacteria bacterium]|nr:AMIN domain-containing protein [Pseudomonadota bacterium]MBU1738946.1 AMIN domain-containing protein [Pseudomonadota bacterium]
MIALMKPKVVFTGIFLFCYAFTAYTTESGAAVSAEKNSRLGVSIGSDIDSYQTEGGMPTDHLIFAAVPSSSDSTSAAEKKTTFQINSLKWEQTAEDFILRVQGDNPPTYTMYELFDPLRVIIDIADASMGATVNLPLEQPQGPVSLVNGKVLEDKEPFIARLEIFLNEDNSYTVERIDNDIIIRFPKSATDIEPMEATAAGEVQQEEAIEPAGSAIETPTVPTETLTEVAPVAAIVVPDENIGAESPMREDIVTETKPMDTPTPEPSADMSSYSAPAPVDAEPQADQATVLFDVEVNHTPTETLIYLKGDGAIRDFKEVKLGKNLKANRPDRIYLDVDNVKLAGPIETKTVGTAVSKIRTAQRKNGFRIVFDSGLETLFDYNLKVQSDGLLVTIIEPSPATALIAGLMKDAGQTPEPEIAPQPEIIATEDVIAMAAEPAQPSLPTSTGTKTATVSEKTQQNAKQSKAPKALEDFAFAGYEKQRITVDFYKIDLHNVFRLFGEVSNLNMVVDESVNGSLTLALNDVPWDFALDIILNLKDLQKEERFNTIVISPKSKKFAWPERTLDTIDFKADLDLLNVQAQEHESIKISKMQDIPETVVEAKKLIHQADIKEKSGQFEAALPLYEDAFKKWPDNIVLAKRIAGLCLVNLSQNAKAVKYAKAALQINSKDTDAALQAAIGFARMMKTDLAKEYFELSINGTTPSSEALTSYSGFCEESQDYDCAINMLKRHNDLHGDTLQTMISKARILDKQGKMDEAANEYRALLLSGYEIPPDLARFIKARVIMAGN